MGETVDPALINLYSLAMAARGGGDDTGETGFLVPFIKEFKMDSIRSFRTILLGFREKFPGQNYTSHQLPLGEWRRERKQAMNPCLFKSAWRADRSSPA